MIYPDPSVPLYRRDPGLFAFFMVLLVTFVLMIAAGVSIFVLVAVYA